MKTKLVSFLCCTGLAYGLPLAGQLHRLWTWQMGVLLLATAFITATQPPVRLSESKANRSADRFSTELIAVCYVLCQAVSVAEWAYYRPDVHSFRFNWPTVAGLFLLVGGLAFRYWSIRLLGRYFTATVQTQLNQRIVRTGAYSIIRHPSYLGAYLVVVAGPIMLHSYNSALVSLVVMFIAYHYRINVEETTLVTVFGSEYADYQRKSKRLLPFVY